MAVADVLALHGVAAAEVRGALMGGYFAGLLNRGVLDTAGSRIPACIGQRIGLRRDRFPDRGLPGRTVAASVLAYFDQENAGQCGSCFNGTGDGRRHVTL